MPSYRILSLALLCALILLSAFFYGASSKATEVRVASQVIPEAPAEHTPHVQLLFLGDMMFDRYIRTRGEAAGYDALLQDLGPLFKTHAAVIANLEGPVTDLPSVSKGTTEGLDGNMRFTFSPDAVQALAALGVGIVSIGNNHIRDFGVEGVVKTRILLSEAGLHYFGDPDDPTHPYRAVFPNLSVAFIAYNQFMGQTVAQTTEAIRRAHIGNDVVVVFAHWGEEYQLRSNTAQQAAAHAFVDSGADLVIGSHPHVVQEWELYKSRRIYYSLGNAVFDQYFSPETQQGLALSVSVDPADQSMSFSEIPIVLRKDGTTVRAAQALP